MTRDVRARLAPRLAALASVLVLVVGVGSGLVRTLVHQCVHLDGPLALLGVRLTLLQDAADCPAGTLAVTPAASHGAVLAFGLVLPVVAAHTALGALGAGLAAVLLRAAGTVRRVLRAVVRALPRPAADRAAAPARLLADRPLAHALPPLLARALHPHRGPPVALA